MPHSMTLIDRLRIELVVWSLDQRLYDLPRQSRIAKRREVRENLHAAVQEIGTKAALRNLGNSRQLAAEFRAAEFGDKPQPAWLTAAVYLFTGQLILTALLSEAAIAFGNGIKAVNPHVTGTFTWSGVHYLQESVTYTITNGDMAFVGGAWTPLAWAIWIVSTIVVGRLWRAIPIRRRKTA